MTAWRSELRVRIAPAGGLEVVDPGLDEVPLLRAVEPGWRIRRSPLPGVRRPRFHRARATGTALALGDLAALTTGQLREAHLRTRSRRRPRPLAPGEASLLDLKALLARRLLAACSLCARRCGVDRTSGPAGSCGLGPNASVADAFVHVGEEPAINPSLVVALRGCGLRCRYCQQWKLLSPRGVGRRLDASLWAELPTHGARSMSFAGGNPDESLPAILEFLAEAPLDWRLPVVWNHHAYCTPEALELLDGVVDVFLPDLKYGADACAASLSGVAHYTATTHAALRAMAARRVPVIVRLLVLPGHVECCHIPSLAFLATLAAPRLSVSVRAQYAPDWRIGPADGALAARPVAEEVESVRHQAARLGLNVLS